MSGDLFTPKMRSSHSQEEQETNVQKKDNAGMTLLHIAQYATILLMGLLPVFFIPGLRASLGFDKTIMSICLIVITVVSISFMALRRSEVKTIIPTPLVFFWTVILAALISGLLSGDVQDSLRGSMMETQTVSFIAVLGLVMTTLLVLQGSKDMVLKTLTFFGLTTSLLLTYNALRVIFGAGFLSFNSFGAVTVSPIGGFNDLAILSGLTIIFGLITLVQLPLKVWMQSVVAGLMAVALMMLMVINFFNIWMTIGFFTLLLLMYLLSKDNLFSKEQTTDIPLANKPKILVISAVVICVVSATFIVAGEYVGGKISQMVNVEYVEVRPSAMSTVDIAKSVYSDDVLFGIGPNRFSDAWRLHKDVKINQTIFWDTDFVAGNSFVSTVFVSTGLLGGILLLLFHLSFLYLGYRMLLKNTVNDPFWYYTGVVSFAIACFVWFTSYLYVPGAGILLIGAAFTGLTFVSSSALLPEKLRSIPLVVNKRRGFIIMAVIILIVIASVSSLFSVGEQYVAQTRFSEAQSTSESLPELEQAIAGAFVLYEDDRFVSTLAKVYLVELSNDLQTVLSVEEPSEDVKAKFFNTAQLARTFAERAVELDETDPTNQAILAGVYTNLSLAGLSEAKDWSQSALSKAQELSPTSPVYNLILAQSAARIGDADLAREKVSDSLKLKQNFTEALFFSTQLDIDTGETESAIATTKIIISIEPNNPARYYQLGILLSANKDIAGSIDAFRAAISLDPEYANARYLLALAYVVNGQPEDALEQLDIVQKTNPENEQLSSLIDQIKSGDYEVPDNLGLTAPVSDQSLQAGAEDIVVTDGDTETDLVTPVNTVPDSEPEEELEEEVVTTLVPVETPDAVTEVDESDETIVE